MEDEYTSPVKVKDLIEFLSQFSPDMPVYLDKDGWAEEEIERFKDAPSPLTAAYILKKRGLFQSFMGSHPSLYINN